MRVILLLLCLLSLIAVVSSIKCYICNSLMDANCQDNYTSTAQFCSVKPSGAMMGKKPVGCRISRQIIKDERSVIRECAYTGTNVEGKSQKGSLGVSRIVTQCSTDLCNAATVPSALLIPATILLIFRL